MSAFLELGMNVLVAALLAITIFYCWLLNKRIQVLQDSKSDLAQMLRQFDHSTRKAADSMATLQSASKKMAETIQQKLEKAGYAVDDLSFMIDRATKVADQMEAGIAITRQKEKLARETAFKGVDVMAQQESPAKPTGIIPVVAERPPAKMNARPIEIPSLAPDIASLLDIPDFLMDEQPEKVAESVLKSRSVASLQTLIEKVAARGANDPVMRSGQKPTAPSPRSRTENEEELIQALQRNR